MSKIIEKIKLSFEKHSFIISTLISTVLVIILVYVPYFRNNIKVNDNFLIAIMTSITLFTGFFISQFINMLTINYKADNPIFKFLQADNRYKTYIGYFWEQIIISSITILFITIALSNNNIIWKYCILVMLVFYTIVTIKFFLIAIKFFEKNMEAYEAHIKFILDQETQEHEQARISKIKKRTEPKKY